MENTGSYRVVVNPPTELIVSANGIKDLLESAETTYQPKPIDKIRVTLCRGSEPCESFSVKVKAKSKLVRALVAIVGKIVTIIRESKKH